MPTASNPATPTAPRTTPRLHRAGRTLQLLATLFTLAFLFAYAHTYLRYGSISPGPQTIASVARPTTQTSSTPNQPPRIHRRRASFRPAHQVKHRARRNRPFYLVTLRRLHRLFSQLLVVRS